MNKEELKKAIEELGVTLSNNQLEQIDCFCQYLLDETKKTNLTAIRDIESVYLKHVYDSLTIVKSLDLTKDNNLLDIGSGAGFPGIILKICFPNLKITLLDSNGKKTNFLNNAIKKLQLTSIATINTRAEEYIKNRRENFGIVTARAVANINILSELAMPFVKIGGNFIAMKGTVELPSNQLKELGEELGCELISTLEFNLPKENSNRMLITYKKIFPTSGKYPRKYDQIQKNPLKIDK